MSRALHDRHVVVIAAVVSGAAYRAQPFSRTVLLGAAVLACVALGARRALVLAAALAIVASALGANALAGLRAASPHVVTREWATLLTDPARLDGGSVGADLRLGHRHVRAYARAAAGDALAVRLAGERVRVSGVVRPLTGVQRERLVSHHIASQLSVDTVDGWKRGNAVASLANGYRRVVERGERALPEDMRPLFGGMVLGDDRGESAELQDAFKAAGLTHLLVVSGQNMPKIGVYAGAYLHTGQRGPIGWPFAFRTGKRGASGL